MGGGLETKCEAVDELFLGKGEGRAMEDWALPWEGSRMDLWAA